MARKSKNRSIKLSKKANNRAIVLIVILIIATYTWTSKGINTKQQTTKTQIEDTRSSEAKETKVATSQQSGTKDDFYISTNGALELPYYNSDTFIIDNADGRYRLLYDTASRSAKWVAYVLTRKDVETPSVGRSSGFKSDPEVVSKGWPTAVDKDYTKTGYDRGHLVPSADRDDTREENLATFYLSNVAPQTPNLNRKTWKYLEDQVRNWALKYDSLYVVTGTICEDRTKQINNGVVIPTQFYKALLVKVDGQWYSQAYVMPNTDSVDKDYNSYSLSVDQLEKKANIDLFYNLDDAIENEIEAKVNDNIFKK